MGAVEQPKSFHLWPAIHEVNVLHIEKSSKVKKEKKNEEKPCSSYLNLLFHVTSETKYVNGVGILHVTLKFGKMKIPVWSF